MERISETKSWFLEKINKINKPMANITKWRREKIQINKIRDEKFVGHNQPQILMKSRKSLETILTTYFQVNWKI
jgi:hypothetical protein